MKYHKIQSIFKRDRETKKFIIGEYSIPELEFLSNNIWNWEEKIDGTNIRIEWDGESVVFGGKTDKVKMFPFLLEELQKIFPMEKFKNIFPKKGDCPVNVTMFGEGIGPRIQLGGRYVKEHTLILFDVRIGHTWLRRDSVKHIAYNFGIEAAPEIGQGTIDEAIDLVKSGFNSTWGDFQAEGLVLRPKVDLLTRFAKRIITKVKYKDFN